MPLKTAELLAVFLCRLSLRPAHPSGALPVHFVSLESGSGCRASGTPPVIWRSAWYGCPVLSSRSLRSGGGTRRPPRQALAGGSPFRSGTPYPVVWDTRLAPSEPGRSGSMPDGLLLSKKRLPAAHVEPAGPDHHPLSRRLTACPRGCPFNEGNELGDGPGLWDCPLGGEPVGDAGRSVFPVEGGRDCRERVGRERGGDP